MRARARSLDAKERDLHDAVARLEHLRVLNRSHQAHSRCEVHTQHIQVWVVTQFIPQMAANS